MNKTCSKCHKELTLNFFYPDATHKHGYSSQCKACQKQYKIEHKNEIKKKKDAYMRSYYTINKDKISAKHKIYWKKYYPLNKNKLLKATKTWQLQLKKDVLNAYGGPICKCCGEKEIIFLSIDHTFGGGNIERKKIFGTSRTGGYHFHHWLRKNNYPNKDKYQVLCMNCQFGKTYNKICPHQLK